MGSSKTMGDAAQNAFLYTAGIGMIDIGTLGGTYSVATSINASGQMVGYSYTTGNVGTDAFLYTPSGGMIDLNSLLPPGSGWVLDAAVRL